MEIATFGIITRWNQVLLGVKKTGAEIGAGALSGPGAKRQKDETLAQCLVRAAQSEVGILLNPRRLERVAVVVSYITADVPDLELHVFRTSYFKDDPRKTGTMAPCWYSVKNIPLHLMPELDREWFLRALQGEKFRAHVFRQPRNRKPRVVFFPFFV